MLKQHVGQAPSVRKGILKGMGLAVGWTILASFAAAWMIDREFFRLDQAGYASMGILLVSGMLIAKTSVSGTARDKMIGSAAGIAGYLACLLAVNWLFFGGETSGFGIAFLVILLGAVIGSMKVRKGRGGQSPRRYKIPGR